MFTAAALTVSVTNSVPNVVAKPFKNFQCLARKITVDGKNVLEAYFSNVNVLLFVKKFANNHYRELILL